MYLSHKLMRDTFHLKKRKKKKNPASPNNIIIILSLSCYGIDRLTLSHPFGLYTVIINLRVDTIPFSNQISEL